MSSVKNSFIKKIKKYVITELFEAGVANDFKRLREDVMDKIKDNYNRAVETYINTGSFIVSTSFITEFNKRLELFNYTHSNDVLKFTSPDIKNFDFSGPMKMLILVMNGVIGEHVEIKTEDYNYVKERSRLLKGTPPEGVPVVLLQKNNSIGIIENILGKKLVDYPLSNSGPVDIFDGVEDVVSERINSITKDIAEKIPYSAKEFISEVVKQ